MKQLLSFAKHYGPLIGTLATLFTCFNILAEMKQKSQTQLKSEVELVYEHKQRMNDLLLRIAAIEARPPRIGPATPFGGKSPPSPQDLVAFYMLNDFDRFYKLSRTGNFSPCVWRDAQDMIYTQLKVGGPHRKFWDRVEKEGMYDSDFHGFVTKLTRMSYRPVYQYDGMQECRENESNSARRDGYVIPNPMKLLRASLD